MIHYVPICFILAILGTLLANPAFYYQLFKRRKEYLKAKEERKSSSPVLKSDYSVFVHSPIWLIIGQIVLFIVAFVFSFWILYFEGAVAIKWSTIFAYLWIPAIAQLVNFIVLDDSAPTCFNDYSIITCFGIVGIIFSLTTISIDIHHKSAYNYFYPYDSITTQLNNDAK